jgi:hypothetical protein
MRKEGSVFPYPLRRQERMLVYRFKSSVERIGRVADVKRRRRRAKGLQIA